jgi:Uncharacterized proteins, LmbE homologs
MEEDMIKLIKRDLRIHLSLPEKTKRKALIIAPHPDDEILGCGGIINQLIDSGNSCKVLLLTKRGNQYHKRLEEFRTALKTIRCCDYELLCYQDGELDSKLLQLTKDLRQGITQEQPSSIFVPYILDSNKDHAITNIAVAKALQGFSKEMMVFMYEIWTPILYPNYYIDVSNVYENKIKSARAYHSQLVPYFIIRRMASINAMRAALIGKEKYQYMEAFRGFTLPDYIEAVREFEEQEVSE